MIFIYLLLNRTRST